jgi:hypothetical protein
MMENRTEWSEVNSRKPMSHATLTPEMIHVLDHLVAETLRFGNMPVSEANELTSLGKAHEALIAAGVKIGSMPLLELCAQHAEHHRSKEIIEPANFDQPAWNPSLAEEGVFQIARIVNTVRNQKP